MSSLLLTSLFTSAFFPYAYTPEVGLPSYATVQMEGQTRTYAARHAIAYADKWWKKRFLAPIEELAHFDAQREMYRALMVLPPLVAEAETEAVAKLAFVGDLMWIRDQWATFLQPDVKTTLEAHDAVFGNLETPIAQSMDVPSNAIDYVRYNSSPDLVRSFRRTDGTPGFAALAMANNHTFDRGDAGALETLDFLAAEGIAASGLRRSASESNYRVITVNGIRFGFYATTWGFNDMGAIEDTRLLPNWLPGLAPETAGATAATVDLADLRENLAKMADDRVDVKIVAVHWGHEFEYYPSPVQMQLARAMVEAGADVIVGGHAHVQQPHEVCFVNGYESRFAGTMPVPAIGAGACSLSTDDARPRKALVMYSLGNFTTTMWSFLCEIGMIQGLEFRKTADGTTDWWLPKHTFVHNQRSTTPGERRLELLSNFVARGCGAGGSAGCAQDKLDFVSYVERHLTSRHIEADEAARLTQYGRDEAWD